MDSSADFTVVPPVGSSGRVSTAKRNPGGTPTAGRGQGQEGVSVSRPNFGLGSFVATSGQKPWPSAGSFVAAYGQFFMAADTRQSRFVTCTVSQTPTRHARRSGSERLRRSHG